MDPCGDEGDWKLKTNKTLIKELRAELHHWQMVYRMEVAGLKRTREKCKEIARKMRALQSQKTLDNREPRV